MKKFAVIFGFDVLVEAENKDEAREFALKEIKDKLPTNICVDGISECDDDWNYNFDM